MSLRLPSSAYEGLSTDTSNQSPQRSWYGASNKFTKTVKSFYEDTSFDRQIKLKDAYTTKINKVHRDKAILKAKTELRKIREEQNIQRLLHEVKLEDEIKQRQAEITAKSEAAKIIQRYVRGYLTRKRIDPIIIQIKLEKTKQLQCEMISISDFCLFHIGNQPEIAARTIQRAFKKFQFRKKLMKFFECYSLLLKHKKQEAAEYLKTSLLVFVAKLRVERRKWEIWREGKLKEIRERLAIIKIKKYWKRKKLSVRIIRDRFKRTKRRRMAMKSKQNYIRYIATMSSPPTNTRSTPPPNDSSKPSSSRTPSRNNSPDLTPKRQFSSRVETPSFDQQDKSALSSVTSVSESENNSEIDNLEKLARVYREKMNLVKISYNIPPVPPKKDVMPYFQEKSIKESFAFYSGSNYCSNTYASIDKVRCSIRSRVENRTRNFMINTPPVIQQRRTYVGDDSPSYMHMIVPSDTPHINRVYKRYKVDTDIEYPYARATAATISRWESAIPTLPEAKSIRHKEYKVTGSLCAPTITFSLKNETKRGIGDTKPAFKVSLRSSTMSPYNRNSVFTVPVSPAPFPSIHSDSRSKSQTDKKRRNPMTNSLKYDSRTRSSNSPAKSNLLTSTGDSMELGPFL